MSKIRSSVALSILAVGSICLQPDAGLAADLSVAEAKRIALQQGALKKEDMETLVALIDKSGGGKSQFRRDELLALLLGHSSIKQLQELKSHSDTTLALHAAWEEVKRSVRVPLIKEVLDDPEFENPESMAKIGRAAADRFLGFVEGRLRLSPPDWWQKSFYKAYLSVNFPVGVGFDHDDIDVNSHAPYRHYSCETQFKNSEGEAFKFEQWFRYYSIDEFTTPDKGGVKLTWDDFLYAVPKDIQEADLKRI